MVAACGPCNLCECLASRGCIPGNASCAECLAIARKRARLSTKLSTWSWRDYLYWDTELQQDDDEPA